MKGDNLPRDNHVSRYCKKTRCAEGVVQGSAFLRRASEPALSVNWLECTAQATRANQLRVVIQELRSRLDVKDGAYLAVLNVGAAIDRVSEGTAPTVELVALHAPTGGIPTHSQLQGMDVGSQIVAEILAEVARSERLYLVADVAAA